MNSSSQSKNQLSLYLIGALCFVLPFILFVMTRSSSLMFDDAAEFALVISLGSIAHPPGTPAYILIGQCWNSIMHLFSGDTILILTLFSSFCIATATSFLFFTANKILTLLTPDESTRIRNQYLSAATALAFAFSMTAWAWANTVEVYAFQVLAISILFYGLTCFHIVRKNSCLLIAALGIGLGLANHHLTMILFLPFVPLFFFSRLFVPAVPVTGKKKVVVKTAGFFSQYISVLRAPLFWRLAGYSFIVTAGFYGWMFWRAQTEHPFMFGKPDTLSGMLYHLEGGSYAKNLTTVSSEIMSARFGYFMKLTAYQLFLFLPFYLAGIYFLFLKKLGSLACMSLLFFLFLFIYQLNNNQWASTDAYLLLPYFMMSVPVLYGLTELYERWKLQYIIPVLLVIEIGYNYKEHDRHDYDVSDSLMHLLDVSSPKNSVVLISDWSTVIQYYYYRIVENFRPDLVVLNYDIKFTHYRILPIMYPEFYKSIQPEYDHFIDELRKVNPHQVENTGCDLNTIDLSNSFRTLVLKMESVCKSQNRSFLTDPKAHVFYSREKFYDPRRFVSGCFMSTIPGDSLSSAEFLRMDASWLKSPMLLNDPAALDKLVDFQAMLDQHISFYENNHDSLRRASAEVARDKILHLQREMKRSMSFAYKIK